MILIYPDENKNWNVSRTCKKSDRSVNEASKKRKLEQRTIKEALTPLLYLYAKEEPSLNA